MAALFHVCFFLAHCKLKDKNNFVWSWFQHQYWTFRFYSFKNGSSLSAGTEFKGDTVSFSPSNVVVQRTKCKVHVSCSLETEEATFNITCKFLWTERSFSALRGLKICLCSNMTQVRLNHLVICHVKSVYTVVSELSCQDFSKEIVRSNDAMCRVFGKI